MYLSPLIVVSWAVLMLVALAAPGDAFLFHVRLTVDVAVLYYAVAAALMLSRPKGLGPARWAWTLGFIAYCVHVAFAFDHVHHWSHADAVRHTEELSGFGNGIYFNHLFTLVWGADVAWW